MALCAFFNYQATASKVGMQYIMRQYNFSVYTV